MSLDWILLGLRILTTIILYAFLGLAFYIVWQDLKQTGRQNVAHSRPLPQLRVLSLGQDELLGVGDTLPLQPTTLLGREPDNTIILHDNLASGHHARIRRENGVWWLEDLDSRNGTLLNELPLSKPTSLANGDIIGIGSVRLRLELGKLE